MPISVMIWGIREESTNHSLLTSKDLQKLITSDPQHLFIDKSPQLAINRKLKRTRYDSTARTLNKEHVKLLHCRYLGQLSLARIQNQLLRMIKSLK